MAESRADLLVAVQSVAAVAVELRPDPAAARSAGKPRHRVALIVVQSIARAGQPEQADAGSGGPLARGIPFGLKARVAHVAQSHLVRQPVTIVRGGIQLIEGGVAAVARVLVAGSVVVLDGDTRAPGRARKRVAQQ